MASTDRRASPIRALTDEYEQWNRDQNLNLGSADEHLFDEALSPEQRAWLHNFVQRWEVASHFESRAPEIWIEGPFGHVYYQKDGTLWAAPMHKSPVPAPFDVSDGVQSVVDDFDTPLNSDQRSAVETALKVAALAPARRVSVIDCAEYSWSSEQDRCAPWLVIVEAPDGTAIFDPWASQCGRFQVDPDEEHGIPEAAAALMRAHNRVAL